MTDNADHGWVPRNKHELLEGTREHVGGYMPLIEDIARRFGRPDHADTDEWDDLRGDAISAAIEALDAWQPERSTGSFATHLRVRVKRRMIDLRRARHGDRRWQNGQARHAREVRTRFDPLVMRDCDRRRHARGH
jgi:DNA-directed RNA polymerase specialized sigma subunit